MSFFQRDLNKEQLLGEYLDTIYPKLNLNFNRITDIDSQLRGIDLIYREDVFIDEKAQLDYIGHSLPTFTFELSYLKDGKYRLGWLFDKSKLTTHYFLITGIEAKDKSDLSKGFSNCIITSISRSKLITHLGSIGLSEDKLLTYENKIRKSKSSKAKHLIKELNPRKQGLIYFSPQLDEKPINLQLRLNYLIKAEVGKRIYPT